ncbi:MAG TPA: hypothetical protein VFJ50_07940 [Gemmatimonadales bacterium]|nr:hypothetical protein [Gemmatimonadales bacterium]
MTQPLVVKFGGDALASPERIGAAARRVAARRAGGPVVAIASARRGITDHLLGLVEQVREAVSTRAVPSTEGGIAADRAVAGGELVAASLLAVALAELNVPAVVVDAREAGLRSDGGIGGAELRSVHTRYLERYLARGVTPVVTGFQGWHRHRITTLGRGGSDITAVAVAAALEARGCELVKDPGALHTADPRLVPDTRPLTLATHRFVTELALAGARVIHHSAAERAEIAAVPLRFSALHGDGDPSTLVGSPEVNEATELFSVVYAPGYHGVSSHGGDPGEIATVTIVEPRGDRSDRAALARMVARRSNTDIRRIVERNEAVAFLLPASDAPAFARAIHAAALTALDGESRLVASSGHA